MSDRIKCITCGAESFNHAGTNLHCCGCYNELLTETSRLKAEVDGLNKQIDMLVEHLNSMTNQLDRAEDIAEICRKDRDSALKRMSEKVISSHKRGTEFLKEFCPDLALSAESWHKFYKMWREGMQPIIDDRDRYRKALERILITEGSSQVYIIKQIAREALEIKNDN